MAKEGEYLRVTEVLYPFSGLKEVPVYILINAQERGTKVHEICTSIMEDIGTPPFEDKYEGYIESFKKWTTGKSFIPRPDRIYCDKHMITGEVDGIYEDDKGNMVLFDIKTPAKEGKTWRAQGSAYSYLCKKEGYNISKIEFIQLSKKGDEPTVYEYKEDFDLFLEDLRCYRRYFYGKKDESVLNDI